MLPRLIELERTYETGRRAQHEGWTEEIEGSDLTLRILADKKAAAERAGAPERPEPRSDYPLGGWVLTRSQASSGQRKLIHTCRKPDEFKATQLCPRDDGGDGCQAPDLSGRD